MKKGLNIRIKLMLDLLSETYASRKREMHNTDNTAQKREFILEEKSIGKLVIV